MSLSQGGQFLNIFEKNLWFTFYITEGNILNILRNKKLKFSSYVNVYHKK